MSKFMITFGAHAMDGIPDEEMPAIADAARGVVREILNAGVYVLSGGLGDRSSSVVGTDGTSPTDRNRTPSARSRSSMCPHVSRPWNGLRRSPSRAAARKMSGRSVTTPNSRQ